MPKVDELQKYEKLQEQLADLKNGKEVAARKMNVVLDEKQLKAIDDAWTHQQQLRKTVKARTKQQQIDAGFKSKRDIHIAIYEQAIKDLDPVKLIEKELRDAEIRQAKIYMSSLNKAIEEGKTQEQAKKIANNNLTRAGLARVDGIKRRFQSQRDKEVFALEAQLKKQLGIKEHDDT
jgi:nitrogen regulatory protein PII